MGPTVARRVLADPSTARRPSRLGGIPKLKEREHSWPFPGGEKCAAAVSQVSCRSALEYWLREVPRAVLGDSTSMRRRHRHMTTAETPRSVALQASAPSLLLARWQCDPPASNHEVSAAEMVERLRVRTRRVHPRLHHFQNDKAVLRHQLCVDDLALEVRVTLVKEWRPDLCSGRRGEAESLELVDPAPGGISASDNLGYESGGRLRTPSSPKAPGSCGSGY